MLASTHADDGRVDALRELGVPFATFGRSWDGDEELAWVDVDGRHGIAAATQHVAEQGHRRIGYVGWPPSEVGPDRRAGWLETCARLRLDHSQQIEVTDDFDEGRARPTSCSTRPTPSPRWSARPTPWRSASCAPWTSAACGPGATSP